MTALLFVTIGLNQSGVKKETKITTTTKNATMYNFLPLVQATDVKTP